MQLSLSIVEELSCSAYSQLVKCMKVVCYNTDENKKVIYSDLIAYRTNSVYLIEHKAALLSEAEYSSLPQFLFLYSDYNTMIGFYFLFGTDNYKSGRSPFVALTNLDELDERAAEYFAMEIKKICLQFNEKKQADMLKDIISYQKKDDEDVEKGDLN